MIIASRKLQLRRRSGTVEVRIDIFRPEPDQGAWRCRYVIGWPKRKWKSYAGGHDSVQALVCALQKIAIELYCSRQHKSGKLSWSDDWKGYGFPIMQGVRDLLVGEDAKFM